MPITKQLERKTTSQKLRFMFEIITSVVQLTLFKFKTDVSLRQSRCGRAPVLIARRRDELTSDIIPVPLVATT